MAAAGGFPAAGVSRVLRRRRRLAHVRLVELSSLSQKRAFHVDGYSALIVVSTG